MHSQLYHGCMLSCAWLSIRANAVVPRVLYVQIVRQVLCSSEILDALCISRGFSQHDVNSDYVAYPPSQALGISVLFAANMLSCPVVLAFAMK